MTIAWLYLLAPAVVAFVAIALLGRARWTRHLLDRPNERSLHVEPTPRIGGIAVIVASLTFAAFAADAAVGAIVACALFLAVISLLDDARSLPVEVRLPAHLLAAAVAVLAMGAASSFGWAEAILATLAIAWMANLYNFMDGADGLAGGMAVIGFGAFAFAAEGLAALALTAAATASAAAGFLLHNFPPARVFMGDAGSVPLGFLAGALGALGVALGAWPAWFPLLVFSPFMVDATVTLARRFLRGERVWKAHREHAYQRLVLAGWSRRRLALAAYALMLAAAASALAALRLGPEGRYAIILAWLATYIVLLVAIERRGKQPA